MYIIRIEFEEGTQITRLEEEEWWPEGLELGYWKAPFPNEKGNSQAFGLIEAYSQSDDYSMIFSHRTPKSVLVTRLPDKEFT
jgi:hypothetical protein